LYATNNPIKLVDPDGRTAVTPEEEIMINLLERTEIEAEARFAKLSTVGKVWDYFVSGTESTQVGKARFNRGSLLAALGRAGPGESIVQVQGQVKGTLFFVTAREARLVRWHQVGDAVRSSALAASVYSGASIAGTKEETKENLTIAAAALSDITLAVGVTAGARQANQSLMNYKLVPATESSRGATLEPISVRPEPVLSRGSATQAQKGVKVGGFPIHEELVVEAEWVGPGVSSRKPNVLGYERGVLFPKLRLRFEAEKLFPPGPKNPLVTPALALRYPEFEPYVGSKLIEHHLAHGPRTYPLPEQVHRA
jgi:hypothetical protein